MSFKSITITHMLLVLLLVIASSATKATATPTGYSANIEDEIDTDALDLDEGDLIAAAIADGVEGPPVPTTSTLVLSSSSSPSLSLHSTTTTTTPTIYMDTEPKAKITATIATTNTPISASASTPISNPLQASNPKAEKMEQAAPATPSARPHQRDPDLPDFRQNRQSGAMAAVVPLCAIFITAAVVAMQYYLNRVEEEEECYLREKEGGPYRWPEAKRGPILMEPRHKELGLYPNVV